MSATSQGTASEGMWCCPECKLLISAVGTALAFPPLVSIERSTTYSLMAAAGTKFRHAHTNTNRAAKVHKNEYAR
jgi:hypothetical protein